MSSLEAARAFQNALGPMLRRLDTHAARDELLASRPHQDPEAFDADGFRIASLMVARLRFERLLQGSATLGAEFERDPRRLTDRFKRYHTETPMRAASPAEEAASFQAWCEANSVSE